MADSQKETGSEGLRRVQFDFSKASYDALGELMKLAGVSTKALVVRNALVIYRYFLEAQRDGKRLCHVKGDGLSMEVEEITFKF